MVDINLIGDDKTGEEEPQEEFTQTTNMDTEELAFEERTETFDTTKTAGFARKRNYSSLVSTLVILGVIVLLGGAIYFFMRDDGSNEDELAKLEQQFADELADESNGNSQDEQPAITSEAPIDEGKTVASTSPETPVPDEPTESISPPVATTKPARSVVDRPIRKQQPQPPRPRQVEPVSNATFSKSRAAFQSVASLMAAVPSNLNTTLLSYAGETTRVEFVAGAVSEAKDFADQLNQTLGQFSIVSENQVAANGSSLEKVLLSGHMGTSSPNSSGTVRFYDLNQAKDWVRSTAQQAGVTVRELKPQPSTPAQGYQKVPLLGRIYGNKAAVLSFLREIGQQEVNVEVTKILLVSPDMVSFSDENLILVLNMYLYEQT